MNVDIISKHVRLKVGNLIPLVFESQCNWCAVT